MKQAETGELLFFSRVKHQFRSAFYSAVYKFVFLVIIFSTQAFSTARAQQDSDYAIHANIIYHFTKYINWPPVKKTGDFIIGVAGDSPLYEELKKNIANKMVGGQKIVIIKFSPSASFFYCHILFISGEEGRNMKKFVSATAGSSTLLVSESAGLARKGSCINFVIVADRLKLEINKNNIEKRELAIASELLQLGKLVK